MKQVFISAAILCSIWLSTFASAASAGANSKAAAALVNQMATACAAEIQASPQLMGTTDGETLWKVLEEKEFNGKISPACDAAEDAYEKQFHFEYWQVQEAKERAQSK